MLKRKKDGSFSVISPRHVHDALERQDEINEEVAELQAALLETDIGIALRNLRDEEAELIMAVDSYVLNNFDGGDGVEDDDYKVTKVVGHTRTWDAEKLRKLVPLSVFKNLTAIVVRPDKIDEYVRARKLKLKDVKSAYIERENKPYVKKTRRNTSTGNTEAADLAAALEG